VIKSLRLPLVVSSSIASFFNFYSFVIFPAIRGTERLQEFVRTNYLGGLYQYLIGGSISVFSVYVLTAGYKRGLSRYAIVSLVILLVIGLGGAQFVRMPWGYFCLVGAVCLQLAGFFLATLVLDQSVIKVGLLQIVQPFFFAALISIYPISGHMDLDWSVAYLLSAIVGLTFFIAASDIAGIRAVLRHETIERTTWIGVLTRIAIGVSFPLFFQLELILCGTMTTVNVGLYAMLQKLYASVSISLFGSLGVAMLAEEVRAQTQSFITTKLVILALACSVVVCLVGAVVSKFGSSVPLGSPLVASAALVAFLFAISSFVGMKLSVVRPYLSLFVLAFSLACYLCIFLIFRPKSAQGVLALAGLFFSMFLIFAHSSRNRFLRPAQNHYATI
jgi:hypothetical protein